MAARITDRDDWFELWFEDKKSILETMSRNMADDLEIGYNFFGGSIQQQISAMTEYKNQMDAELDSFKAMDEKQVSRWCFYDLKKRGVIE